MQQDPYQSAPQGPEFTPRQPELFSLHWELKTILYLGVLLLSGGLGTLIYQNIDSISHQAILAAIALVSAGSFYYCYKQAPAFSCEKVKSPTPLYDYLLLLGCLTFISFIGYLQYAYTVFGTRYGLATAIPLVVIFFSAYYFDHIGVLSLAITNLAAWLGLTITPLNILTANDFSSDRIIYTGIGLGILLLVLAILSVKKRLKSHFSFTYMNFGVHTLFISLLAAIIELNAAWMLLLTLFAVLLWRNAFKSQSVYFLAISVLYMYIGLTYLLIVYVFKHLNDSALAGIGSLGIIWLIVPVGICVYLYNLSKKFKNDSL